MNQTGVKVPCRHNIARVEREIQRVFEIDECRFRHKHLSISLAHSSVRVFWDAESITIRHIQHRCSERDTQLVQSFIEAIHYEPRRVELSMEEQRSNVNRNLLLTPPDE